MAKRSALLIATGAINSTVMVMLSPGITISSSFRQVNLTGYVSGAQVKLGTIFVVEWRVTSTFFFLQDINLALNLVCGVIEPGLAITIPLLISVFVNTTKQQTYVITSLPVKDLTEHLNTSNSR
jgi:hypothetical protein